MSKPTRSARVPLALLAFAVWLSAGCASRFELPDDFDLEPPNERPSGPLGGQALHDRKSQLTRAQRDMVHFHTTLESLQQRRDRNGFVMFSGFLDAYMGLHLDPMLAGEWQSTHPELMALDANLRFAQAAVFIQMRSPARVQEVIEEIEARYANRGSMLVEFPIGRQSTLEQGLELLRSRKWRG